MTRIGAVCWAAGGGGVVHRTVAAPFWIAAFVSKMAITLAFITT